MAIHPPELLEDRPTEDDESRPNDPNSFNLLDLTLTDQNKEDELDKFMARFKASKDHMEKLYPSMLINYKRYRSIAEPIEDDFGNEIEGRSNLYIPYPWAIVESELPRLAGRLPKVRAFPRNPSNETEAEAIQDLMYYSLDRMEFIHLNTIWQRQHAMYGWSPLYYWWRVEDKTVLVRDVKTGLNGEKIESLKKETKRVWDDFAARVLDCFDSFMQPGVEDLPDGDWFIFREWRSDRDLKAMVHGGLLYDEVLKYLEENKSVSNFEGDSVGRKERDELVGITKGTTKHSYGRHELLYMLEDDKLSCVLDRSIYARSGDNPNPQQIKSVINLKLTPLISEPIGVSIMESLGGLPDKLNAMSNARLDNISILVNRVVLANRFAQTDFDNLTFTAGNVILTDNLETSVKFLDTPDISNSSAVEILSTKEEMQFVSGVSDFIVGVQSSARLADTATGVSTIVREANARFALKLSTFEGGPLRRLVEAIHSYSMLYMPYEKKIHVLGPKGYVTKDITVEQILCDCEFIVEPGSSVPLDQVARREALTQLLGMVQSAPQIIDQEKFYKEVFDSHDIRNVDDMFIRKDDLPEIDDIAIAEAENIAMEQGQNIDLVGNHQLHLAIHQQGVQNSQGNQQNYAGHIQMHTEAFLAEQQALVQQQLLGGFGNGNDQNPPLGGGGSAGVTPTTGGQESIQGFSQLLGGT